MCWQDVHRMQLLYTHAGCLSWLLSAPPLLRRLFGFRLPRHRHLLEGMRREAREGSRNGKREVGMKHRRGSSPVALDGTASWRGSLVTARRWWRRRRLLAALGWTGLRNQTVNIREVGFRRRMTVRVDLVDLWRRRERLFPRRHTGTAGRAAVGARTSEDRRVTGRSVRRWWQVRWQRRVVQVTGRVASLVSDGRRRERRRRSRAGAVAGLRGQRDGGVPEGRSTDGGGMRGDGATVHDRRPGDRGTTTETSET